MQSALICAGILLLALAGMGTQLRRRRQRSSPVRQLLYLERLLRGVQKLLNMRSLQTESMPLQNLRHEIAYLQQNTAALAILPRGRDCLPRLLPLARALMEAGVPSPEAMAAALADCPFQCTAAEIAALPLALGYVQAERLDAELNAFLHDGQNAALISDTLWQRAECFSSLRLLRWLEHGEQVDPCHLLLLEEPSGTYTRMTPASRLALRLDAERFARHAHLSTQEVLSHVLGLCRAAGKQALEAYAGFWLQTAPGMAQLHRSLGIRAGFLYARLIPQKALCRYILRCILGGIAGFAFLQAGHPVFMLPFFAICVSVVVRRIINLLPENPLPAVIPDRSDSAFRILAVRPVMLKDTHDAVMQAAHLQRTSRILCQDNVDFLLLCDLPAHMTAISGQDGFIAQSALAALASMGDHRMIYLQRGRVWNDADHIYQCRGGTCGALQELCRLIVRGESLDPITCVSVDPAGLERQYAYLLALPENTLPTPEMLERMLGTLMHPINARYPVQNGWRGYSLLSPADRDVSDGCWLLRPDAFLEATEDYTREQENEQLLCAELSGYAAVHGDHTEGASADASWEAALQRAGIAWRLLPWQLPWVRTSAGLVRNPLRYFSRFHLRDRLREVALPVAQAALLLWAILTGRWTLLALALLAPALSSHAGSDRAWHMRLLSLPTRAAISVMGLILTWASRKRTMPSGYVLELWAQWIAAAVLIGLTIAVPGMRVPSLLLAAGFAAVPLLQRKQH